MTESNNHREAGTPLAMPKSAERVHQFGMGPLVMGLFAVLIYFGITGGLNLPFWVGAGWCAIVSLLAFQHFVKALTYGYGLALFGQAVITGVFFTWSPAALFAIAAVGFYGARMFLFTVIRERVASYGRRKKDTDKANSKIPLAARFGIWFGLIWLYAGYAFPLQMMTDPSAVQSMLWVGGAFAWIGLGIEMLADRQKSTFKAAHGDSYCSVGLYRLCRYPNYAGEILFQYGVIVAGVGGAAGLAGLAAAFMAPGIMIVVMFGQMLILKFEQDARYKDADGFAEYQRRTPSLLPRLF